VKVTGATGWAVIVVFVAAWDYTAPETLSAAFARAHPAKVVVWGILTAHLFKAVPRKYDPFYLLVRR
jgi:hypothetical protein